MNLRPLRGAGLFLAILAAIAVSAFAIQRAVRTAGGAQREPTRSAPLSSPLANVVPGGALLTIESPDFAALLHAWTSSPESALWLRSANYSVFSNSRLFARLADAQAEFASAATLDKAGTSFLAEIAGRQSIFAWYDVGNLEFLYITRMPSARAAQTRLLQARSRFSRREAGRSVFYIRTQAANEGGAQRTVAFATAGDLLLLATREDLMANALQMIDHTASAQGSVAQEPWYQEVLAASEATRSSPEPALHMVLNLDRIVPLPSFRTYWVQRNVTAMRQYRSAVADLYREPSRSGAGNAFREERTLLLKSSEEQGEHPPAEVASLAALVPPESGVFRAFASAHSADAVEAVEEKLLGRAGLPARSSAEAPDPGLRPAPEGSSEDLETRIDTPPPQPESASSAALAQALDAAGLDAILTADSAVLPAQPASTLAVPIPSAVVLRTARPLDSAAFRQAVQQALRGSLTAWTLGIEFRPVTGGADARTDGRGAAVFSLSGPKPLLMAFSGNLCVLSTDSTLLSEILSRVANRPAPSGSGTAEASATLIAAFHHRGQREPFKRLAALIDGTGKPAAPTPSGGVGRVDTSPAAPQFFSDNLRSLSDSLATLESERVVVRKEGEAERQTVVYQWRR